MSGDRERDASPEEGTSPKERIGRALRHDLKNPLAVVLGRCEMLTTGALGELDERQLRSLEIIHRNATRMVEMLEELGELARELPDEQGDSSV